MVPPIDQIRNNYKGLPDQKLMDLATYEANGLRPEALEALKEELAARGLDKNIEKAVEVQKSGLTEGELQSLVQEIRSLPCPLCHQRNQRLNAVEIENVKSFLVFTTKAREILVRCPDCLEKINNKAILQTALLGWWGFPWGIIRTPIALYNNYVNKGVIKNPDASDDLRKFVLAKSGGIIQAGDDERRLVEIIR